MTDDRRYIDTETGWQFSLADLFLLAPLVGMACLAAVKFAHPSNPEVIFQAAVFVLPLLLAELLVTVHTLVPPGWRNWASRSGQNQRHQ